MQSRRRARVLLVLAPRVSGLLDSTFDFRTGPKTCDKVLKKAKKKGSVCKPWKSKTCPGGKWIRSNSNKDGATPC